MKRLLAFGAKVVVTATILYLIASKLDLEQILSVVASVSLTGASVAIALLLVQTVITAFRWMIVMASVGVTLNYSNTLKALFASLTLNQCFPSYIGGDAYRAYWAHSRGFGVGACARGVLIDRISAVIALVLMLTAFMPRLFRVFPDQQTRVALSGLLLAGWGGTIVFLFSDLVPLWFLKRGVLRQMGRLSTDARRTLLGGWKAVGITCMAVAIHLLTAMIFYTFAAELNTPVGAMDCVVLMPVIVLLSALPISVAGWGIREGIFIGALAPFGVDPELAVAISVSFGLTALAGGLLGVVPLLLDWDRLTALRRLRVEPSVESRI